MANSEDVTCPFCKKKGFDLIGLKYHFEMGYCDAYNGTLTVEEERLLKQVAKAQEASHDKDS